MEMRGNRPLSRAMLTLKQNRTVTVGNAGDRALNLHIKWGKWGKGLRLPLRDLKGGALGDDWS
jgi:hypothetical protein